MVSIGAALDRMRACSPFLSRVLELEPQIAADPLSWISDPMGRAVIDDPAMPVARRLRVERRRIALVAALGDLSGAVPLEATMRLLSDFADHALDEAIRAAIQERTPGAIPAGFAAIALGKQGSRELNYSSDIDPILLFDPETLPHKEREAPEEAAVRIGRRVVELLQARDGDGYVLRVDLRLRPSPEATPIVLPVNAAISYYESHALAWERAAFIRARAAAGDRALGARFLTQIRPFVWRRALDFGAIAEIRALTARIRDHYAQGQRFGPGYDLKRGRGGIREVEFFAQVHQLIHGGRDPALRAPATLDALAALAQAGWVDGDEAALLAAAYRRLRTVEHRLQMVDDRQTHSLPTGESLDQVARLDGLADGAALLDSLAPCVARVGAIYDRLGGEGDDTGAFPDDAEAVDARFAALGFAEPEQAARRIAAWRSRRYPALRSAAAQAAMERALPGLLDAFARSADPGAALLRLDALLAKLPSAINLFNLLEARAPLARLLADILCHAPTLAEVLGRRVELLDGLIDASALAPVPDTDALASEMARADEGDDYQARLDHVRRIVNERRFALGAQIIAGVSDPLDVSAGYARVAEAAIHVLADATIAEFVQRHGRVPGSELLILALGRLGGGLLTHASDLDLIFLFTGDYLAESDGEKPLGAVLYYNRLAQRISGALSVPTASGPLYEVDTRLRPSGTQGPISVSLAGFAKYQRENAWTWEHMALTRARPVYGSAPARLAVQREIDRVLAGDRTPRNIAADAVAMRGDIAAHKPPTGPFDAKLMPGGLVDLEFAVHTAQLTSRSGFSPDLRGAIAALAGQGVLPVSLGEAHDFLTRMLVTLRLVAPDSQAPDDSSRPIVARAMGVADWDAVVASFAATRQEVSRCWEQVTRPRNRD